MIPRDLLSDYFDFLSVFALIHLDERMIPLLEHALEEQMNNSERRIFFDFLGNITIEL
jgi:hypothetical protein